MLATDRFGLPTVAHWGARLDERDLPGLIASADPAIMFSSLDAPRSLSLIADRSTGWSGTPAVELSANGRTLTEWRQVEPQLGPDALHLRFRDAGELAEVQFALALDADGVLRARPSVRAIGPRPVDVHALRVLLPCPIAPGRRSTSPASGAASAHHSGCPWSSAPTRDAHRGKPGHDSPYLIIVGTAIRLRTRRGGGCTSRGAATSTRSSNGYPRGRAFTAVIGGGETLRPGEVRLAPGERYDSPELLFAWSDAGLDGDLAALPPLLRARPTHPAPRGRWCSTRGRRCTSTTTSTG